MPRGTQVHLHDSTVDTAALCRAPITTSLHQRYTSDHGFHLGEMSMPYFKCQPYDTDLRVPFLIRGPGIQPGRRVSAIGLNVDIAPTIADLVYTVPPDAALVDGHSLAPHAFGTVVSLSFVVLGAPVCVLRVSSNATPR